MRTLFPLLLMAAAFCQPARAIVTCFLTQNNQTVRGEGITERLGDLRLSCGGGAPNQLLSGTLTISIEVPLTNKEDGNGMVDVRLMMLVGGNYITVADKALRISTSMAAFSGLNLNFDAAGGLALLITNVRATGRSAVRGSVSFSGSPQLLVTTPFVLMSNPVPSLMAGFSYMIPTYSNELPPDLDFNTLMSLPLPHVATRITEGTAAAFETKTALTDTGTRLMVRYRNMPPAGRILVPDFIVGRPSFTPTSAGDFGTVISAGTFVPRPNGALFLSRVRGSDINGAGGQAIGMGVPGPVGDVDRYQDFFQAVYEVMDSDPAVLESAQIPAFLWIPPGAPIKDLVRQSVTYAPLSNVLQTSQTAPVPRFTAVNAPADCPGVGDCNAAYFPHLSATPNGGNVDFTAPQGGGPYQSFVVIRNDGGSVLEWNTTINYIDGDGWLTVQPPSGFNDATVAFSVTPAFRATGKYRASVTITAPVPSEPVSFLVTMDVRPPAAPPPPPPAVITGVLNAATRYGLPIAPGSLAIITGGDFTANTNIVIGGRNAPIVGGTSKEITVVVPSDLPEGRTSVVAYKGEVASLPYGVDIVEVAPAIFGVLNADSARNSETAPAGAGTYIQVFGTGIPESSTPWLARIHDVWVPQPDFAGPSPGSPGLIQFNFKVPADFPTMPTEVQICGTPRSAPGTLVCSLGFKIWVVARVP